MKLCICILLTILFDACTQGKVWTDMTEGFHTN